MSKRALAIILFILSVVMVVLGWAIQGLPPIVTAIGFAAIGYYFYTSPS
jgi:outer membrane lipoprotein-sorting protein